MKLVAIDRGPSPDRAGHVRLSGVVRYDDARGGPAEETYWYDVPAAFEADLSVSGDPWLAALLPLAYVTGEPLVLTHAVDALLLDHARDLMDAWRWWHPGRAPVAIEADARPPGAIAAGTRTASYFSGGVDSFHTALVPRAAPIDDLLLVLGTFDLARADEPALGRVRASMQAAADALGKTLVPVTANHMSTRLAASDPKHFSGLMMLASAALALERRFARVLVSTSVALDWSDMEESEPVVIPLTSTSGVRFESAGISVPRVEREALVARSEAARRALRVCFTSGGETNCMACVKCLRTAVALEALGGLDRWPTFGGRKLEARRVARATVVDPVDRYFFAALPGFCRRHGREDLARAVERALARSRRHDAIRPLVRWLRGFPGVGALTHRLEGMVQDVDLGSAGRPFEPRRLDDRRR